jgi:hypothetical protein
MSPANGQSAQDVSWFSVWSIIFLGIAMAISFVLLLALFFPLGLLASEHPVYGVLNIALSGLISDQILRRSFGVRLMALRWPTLPLVWLWLCAMVVAAVIGFDGLNTFIKSIAPPGH